MTDKPTPPDGYELVLGKDTPTPLPKGVKVWGEIPNWGNGWSDNGYEILPQSNLEYWYAVPVQKHHTVLTPTEIGQHERHVALHIAAVAGLDPKKKSSEDKPQLQLIPPVLEIEASKALLRGSVKHGPWNWRDNQVEIMTYLGAMKRHIGLLLEGEDIDPDTGAHHLGCVAAGCGIVLDARQHGTLVDNRPPKKQTA